MRYVIKVTAVSILVISFIFVGIYFVWQNIKVSGEESIDKKNVIFSKIEKDELGKEYVLYGEVTANITPAIDHKEVIEKRTNTTVTRLEKENPDGSKEYSVESGYLFHRKGNNWHEVKIATTTPEKYYQTSWLDTLVAWAADTGFLSPSSYVESGSGEPWFYETFAYSENDSGASSNPSTLSEGGVELRSGYTQMLELYDFGFSISTGAVMDGIEVVVRADNSQDGGSTYFRDVRLRTSSGTYVGDDKSTGASVGSAYTNYTFGGSSDDWNTTLTTTDINSSNFGVGISFNGYANSDQDAVIYIDHVKVKVYYTESAEPSSNDNIIKIDSGKVKIDGGNIKLGN